LKNPTAQEQSSNSSDTLVSDVSKRIAEQNIMVELARKQAFQKPTVSFRDMYNANTICTN